MFKPWRGWDSNNLEPQPVHREPLRIAEAQNPEPQLINADPLQEPNPEQHVTQPLPEEPDTRKKKNTYLSVETKSKILNVYNSLADDESIASGTIKRTAQITKTPYTTVWRIVNTDIKKRKKRKDAGNLRIFNKTDHPHFIRNIIYSNYSNKLVLTMEMLHNIVKRDLRIDCCKETLRLFVHKIGFRYRRIDKRFVLMESKRISEWRTKYLYEIEKAREENKNIIYLDETWYDTHDTVKKGFVDGTRKCKIDVPPSRGKRIIILHAGSDKGWVENALFLSAKNIKDAKVDYHQDMSAEVFEKWFTEWLLPNIPANSVIVMDNASYHSAQKEKIPNSNSNKETIKTFLMAKDLYYEETYTKKQLLELLATRDFPKLFNVDTVAAEHGHKIIRTPPYHAIFNPIELIWAQLKSHIRRNNTNPKFSPDTINVIKEEVKKIGVTNWASCVKHVIGRENEYRVNVPPLIINLSGDSESESESDSGDFLEDNLDLDLE